MNAGEDLHIHATALVKAVQQGHFKMVKLLAESGANIAAWYTLGEGQETTTINAVKMAQMKGHNEILAYLYSKSENEMNKLEWENNNSIFNYVENKIGEVSFTLSEIVSISRVEIDVHVIMPTEERNAITLFTTGMSTLPMAEGKVEEELQYAELIMTLPPNWPINEEALKKEENNWPLGWIRQIAHLSHMYEGWIDEGIIIPNEEPPQPFANNTKMSSLLIMRPCGENLQLIDEGKGVINLYQLIPLHETERQIAIEKGSDYIVKQLKRSDQAPYFENINRSSVC
ncbi:suppressor of fused domain protein [Priestia megaterium]|nr:suppressor of fused domain protein [Priestia megaterium]QDZ80139.1 suppressor of fused domain protein [Priestia megaterium]